MADEEARLLLGLNTLPDPPFPAPGYIGFPAQPGAWAACGGDLVTLLREAAWSIRAVPVLPGSEYGPEYHRIQQLLRQDVTLMSYPPSAADDAVLVLRADDATGKGTIVLDLLDAQHTWIRKVFGRPARPAPLRCPAWAGRSMEGGTSRRV